jgi:hypothetical protein
MCEKINFNPRDNFVILQKPSQKQQTQARGVLGAGAPLDAIPTTIEDCLSRLPVASFLWSILTAVSSQNEFLS